jgi:uncharacterized protein (TIGR00369 family)
MKHPDLAALREFLAMAPFMVDLGVEAVACESGRVTTAIALRDKHLQHTGRVHAGVMAALADHTMGAAAQTMAPDNRWIVTAELKTSLLRGAAGERLVCEAHVIKPGRSVSFTEAEVWVEQGGRRTLAVKASATMALIPRD